MKNKDGWKALAIGVGALAFLKMRERRKTFKAMAKEHKFTERGPIGFMNRVREMSDEEYDNLKQSVKEKFAGRGRCSRRAEAVA